MAVAMIAAGLSSKIFWATEAFLFRLPLGRPQPNFFPGSKGRPRFMGGSPERDNGALKLWRPGASWAFVSVCSHHHRRVLRRYGNVPHLNSAIQSLRLESRLKGLMFFESHADECWLESGLAPFSARSNRLS